MKKRLSRHIKKKLKNYKVELNSPDLSLPYHLTERKRVAVIGGGIAGISAAANLGERGFHVDLYEKANFLGGKVGSWNFESNGETLRTEHGFHAFFRQYYNLRSFMKKIGSFEHLIPIDDYIILLRNGNQMGFQGINNTPAMNILDLRKKGVFNLSTFFNPLSIPYLNLLKYNKDQTYRKYDHMSFETFAQKTRMPKKMRLVFNTFARAFFSEPDKMSMAELIKGFHFYFLSNDEGLIYDVLEDDFQYTFIDPCIDFLKANNVSIHLNTPINNIERTNDAFVVHQENYDYCVLATDVQHIKPLVEQSSGLNKYPHFKTSIQQLQTSDRYAVLRIWTDQFENNTDLPFFIFTDRFQCLDSITLYHRMEKESAHWSKENNGGIYELHSYALPDTLQTEEEIRQALLQEFLHYFPELKHMSIRHSYFQHKKDFPAFHTGLHLNRPTIDTEVPGLFLAGDWVKMESPSMLMEAAYTSGAIAANAILSQEGIRTNLLESVPSTGLLVKSAS